ncbi:MAG: hypothetical protein WBC04_02075 [Candidatus Acidiferrales bacterium]
MSRDRSKEYLPDTVDVPMDVMEDLARQKRTSEIERLTEQFVVLGIPEHYLRRI